MAVEVESEASYICYAGEQAPCVANIRDFLLKEGHTK